MSAPDPMAPAAGAWDPAVDPDRRPPMRPVPVVLEGPRVRLEPLDLSRHEEGLMAAGLDPELWRWTATRVRAREDLRAYLDVAARELADGVALPFATVERASGRVAGSTRFRPYPADRRVEIGWTWLGRAFQRTHVNTEAKYLMLRHAFESWGCVRVELKTHALNQPSRRAIERIGGVYEGTHRRQMRLGDGTWRDTAWYSILDHEWPAVKARLEERIAR